MSRAFWIFPIDDGEYFKKVLEHANRLMIHIPDTLPRGRFPTKPELRQTIITCDYELGEGLNWDVISSDDQTTIEFDDGDWNEDSPISFKFRRGHKIVLDIMQNLANLCGSFLITDYSGGVDVLIVPDSVLGLTPQPPHETTFVSVMTQRMPIIIDRLMDGDWEDALFLLSQIRQALSSVYEIERYDLFKIVYQAVSVYINCLWLHDARVRILAFGLVMRLRHVNFVSIDVYSGAIDRERDSDTKARMIWMTDDLISKYTGDRWTQPLLDVFFSLSEDNTQTLEVRFAAANLRTRSQLGFLTPTIRKIFVEALIQPKPYVSEAFWKLEIPSAIIREVLLSINKLLLHHRISILLEALPRITYAEDAHWMLVEVLDHVFYGQSRNAAQSMLPEEHDAERPETEGVSFRFNFSTSRLYAVNPVKITVAELLPFQRDILERVMDIDLPWMVHSNILEKYGLPATRAAVRAMLREE